MPALDPTVRHLYVHVPFCPTICPYCDFHVLTRRAGLVEKYLERVEEEAARLAGEYAVDLDTVYIGGGTPSFLRDPEITALSESIRRHLGWGRLENTLEINPGTVSADRAALWRDLGFDRASVGVQSLDDATLKFLGRQHDARQAREAVTTLVDRGFRVSGDLITAVPGQPLESDIRGLVDLGVGHVSAYTLTIEPGTEFARRGVTVEEDDERAGFERTEELLTALGFTRYEVSNYARPGQESRHNLAYWLGRTYLGLGPGAAGHYPAGLQSSAGQLYESAGGGGEQMADGLDLHSPLTTDHSPLTLRRTNPHLHDWLTGKEGEVQPIDAEEYVTDALFMGLRLREGLNLADLTRRSGLNVRERYARPLAANVRRGLLTLEGDQLRATPTGWWLLNRVVAEFLEA
ncbi:radical SAM family heme chaperone HemW [Deinococcus metallilatus]|uniref:Heme chaperone HemW n=1 Tax=Deinococcus metallilatus TaxID=1211322 RepID=A0AAJ5F639_9DEIO|nr:radical SAM family heme chaperone HemW [Deinococcus metallilatus]MBB5294648.1 oxygen-independent coproporphyrinogen-3 oxidase [Deinococcus metallilatus]QBY07684.1 radical SAM family heme chaperone HemW [Deinococcus metallilatus]RXJ14100.1 radical SAM family heme chaperone HemW [Deinococcus metallilatus]TLK30065.1 radical SAM family heme chaperone HemW [Deinococcus metallilatus]GMA15861.1 coproporphyrinogen III oxidase [Deinococcus metallilatus]